MERPADRAISVQTAAPRAIAAVRARLPISRIPAVFAQYLNQVYAVARSGAMQLDGQNIFVYRNVPGAEHEVDVEFGVGVKERFAPHGQVSYSELPVGEVATGTLWGDYARLGEVHSAVISWCNTHNRTRTGTRWEVYGHWDDDPTRRRTDVYHLLAPPV